MNGNRTGSYTTSFLSPSGKVLWTQPEPAVEQSESFYPKRYISAQMALNLLPKTSPGEYTIVKTQSLIERVG